MIITSFRLAFRRKKAVLNKKRNEIKMRRFVKLNMIPLHGAHVKTPKFNPIAFVPHIAH